MNTQRKPENVIISSTISSAIATFCINPIDLIKVRQQKMSDSKNCYTCRRNSVTQKISSLSSSKPSRSFGSFSDCTRCFPQNSLFSAFKHIVKFEGPLTLFNGVRYATVISCTSTVSFFYFYERIKNMVYSNITTNSLIYPFLSSFAARGLATSITFPLDYWKTLQYSSKGNHKKKNFELGNKVFSAYSVTIQRDLLFSVTYWSLVENIRKLCNESGNFEQNSIWSNIYAGSIAGAVASFISLPLDVIKTRKQIYKEFSHIKTYEFLKQIKNEGKMFAGIKPRILKTMIHCSIVLTGYEYIIEMLEKPKYNL